jgi:CHAT domain-containing protein
MIRSEKQLEYLKKKLDSSSNDTRAVRNAYASLDLSNWSNLPGTLSEVININKVVKNSKVITGKDVTEYQVKQLSKNGDLRNYKAIHFATHGLVVPEIPELSAIVLSQFKDEPRNEDGYLRMGEISELNIRADFVNLSACETGLGKIYGGEGVVGFTHSFFIAGANGLSVSLWQVADISTSKFMVAVYGLVVKQDVEYIVAINEIKRHFIRGDFGDNYRAPYYWAPFVYYGK